MDSYGLTRDDGAGMALSANAWEAALEVAFREGWRPAGTAAPTSVTELRASWDAHDYFSRLGQRVQAGDAGALGRALADGLTRDPHACARVSARMSERSDSKSTRMSREGDRHLLLRPLQRLAAFAQGGGFTIHSG